ncbi:hypothetical protein [Mesorhizobium loti]|uniref:hypothetical protein n=1 Tax=Rhizobium loti TaxID=381 RepID=UPI00047E261D|nr:hypothetical protein [Mesorhizobium loti]
MDVSAAEQVASAAKIATSLEPLASTALAINLAYLGLARFRYREKIRAAADAQRRVFEPAEKPAPENIKSMRYYKQLRGLCSLSNHDVDDIAHADREARISSGVWSHIYHHLYRKHLDRYIAYAGAGLSGFTVASAVALNLGTWSLTVNLYGPSAGVLWLYTLIAASLAPIILVYVGRKIVHYAAEHAVECREEIEKAMQTGSLSATLPEGVANVVPISPTATGA